ncbi:mechanosensitive ion channel [Fulvivirga ulvae]|uniref:mechanosensitive ion channel family protein n=1 Tax=Fulvivirga ulvae TaxID=2904245 RepID=UPI001F300F9A|nr:mechanosensitive ion channel domain-containing protein [Fulvivirga ulvae]UII31604.1 mechanosensitive ion channel [Fulvivirga ulvae]
MKMASNLNKHDLESADKRSVSKQNRHDSYIQKARKRPDKAMRRKRGTTVKGAQNRLKQFKQATILAVAITGFLMLILAPEEAGYTQSNTLYAQTGAIDEKVTTNTHAAEGKEFTEVAKNEAIVTVTNIWRGFYANLPKFLIALVTLIIAWLLVKLIRSLLSKTIGKWKNGYAITTLVIISVWLFAIGVAVSVVAGDIRALVGSLGLVGLALSWSLQTPIESFTGWLQNSFQGYYRVGDRVSVGEVFGDVYKIDFLTTTVWEIGAPYRQGFVQAEQPTGRLVTFPNNEILSGTVVNLTRDFSFVWDELAIAVANESNIKLAMDVINNVASDLLGDYIREPSEKYSSILKKANLNHTVADKPEIYLSLTESWTDIVVRYLVGARERRKWKSELILKVTEELNKDKYKGKIIPVYPRKQVQFIDAVGTPYEAKSSH